MSLAERYNRRNGRDGALDGKEIPYSFQGVDEKCRIIFCVQGAGGAWERVPEGVFPSPDQCAPESIADVRAATLARAVLREILKKPPEEQRGAEIDARSLFVFAGLSGDSDTPKARFTTINLGSGLRSSFVELSAEEIGGRLDDRLTPKRHRAEYRAALEALDAVAPTPAPRFLPRPMLEAV